MNIFVANNQFFKRIKVGKRRYLKEEQLVVMIFLRLVLFTSSISIFLHLAVIQLLTDSSLDPWWIVWMVKREKFFDFVKYLSILIHNTQEDLIEDAKACMWRTSTTNWFKSKLVKAQLQLTQKISLFYFRRSLYFLIYHVTFYF